MTRVLLVLSVVFALACSGNKPPEKPAEPVPAETEAPVEAPAEVEAAADDAPVDVEAPAEDTPSTPPAEQAGGTVTLKAGGGCTRKRCPEEDPCCNNCNFGGWRVDGSGTPASGDLPTCELDGCGSCAFTLEAQGAEKDGTFVVTSFEQKNP
jgi:hypothetical protein